MLHELRGKTITIQLGVVVGVTDSVKGQVTEVSDAWIKLKNKKKVEFINIASIARITVAEK